MNQSITAITSKEPSKRKSIWVRGTFGTGKSHASAVVKHLLCDDFDNISSYIETIPDEALKSRVKNLRQSGRKYFAVTLKGVEKAYDIPRFTLSLQRETQRALKSSYPDFIVPSDYLSARDWILNHRDIFEANVLGHDEELDSTVATTEDVLGRLEVYDTGMYLMVERAIRETASRRRERKTTEAQRRKFGKRTNRTRRQSAFRRLRRTSRKPRRKAGTSRSGFPRREASR